MARRQRGPGPGSAATSVPLPDVGSLVTVEVDGMVAPSTSRVEVVDGWRVTVVAPTRGGGRPVEVEPGTPVAIGWGDEAGWWQATSTLTALDVDVVALWQLTTERVERWQRREAFRLEVAVPVELHHGGDTFSATTLDISELGLRCRVPARSAPRPQDRVTVDLWLPEGHEALPRGLPARVARAEPLSATQVELGLALEVEDPAVGECLRRFVFEMQLDRRRRR